MRKQADGVDLPSISIFARCGLEGVPTTNCWDRPRSSEEPGGHYRKDGRNHQLQLRSRTNVGVKQSGVNPRFLSSKKRPGNAFNESLAWPADLFGLCGTIYLDMHTPNTCNR